MNNTITGCLYKRIQENLCDAVRKGYDFLKYPAIYTVAFDALSSTMEGIKFAATKNSAGALEHALNTAEHNVLMFGITNIIYGRGVDFLTRKFGKKGAWGLFAATNIIQYTYLLATQDADPTFQCSITAAVAAYLTRLQVKDIEKSSGLEKVL